MNFNTINHHNNTNNHTIQREEMDDSFSIRSGISEETIPRPESVALSNFYFPPKSRLDDEYSLDIVNLRSSFYETTLKSAKTQNGLLISELTLVRGTPAFALVGTNYLWVGATGITVFDTDTLKEERKLARGDPPIQVRSLLSLDREVWTGYCDGAITVWNSTTYQPIVSVIQTQSTGVLSLALGRPGEVWVGCEDWKVRLFNAHTKIQIKVLESVCRDWVRCILSVDNRMWIGTDKGIFIWDKNETTFVSEDTTKQSALCMTLVGVTSLPTNDSPLANESIYSSYHATPPPALHPHPSSSSSPHNTINRTNTNNHSNNNNNIPTTPPSTSPDFFHSSHHGHTFPQHVWVGGSSDGNINVWAATPGQGVLIQTIPAHSKEVTCLLNVGNHTWSGSLDGTIRVWDKKNYSLVQTIDVYFPVRSLIFVGNEVWVGGFKRLQVRLATSLLEWSDFELKSQIIHKSNHQENYSKVMHEKLLLEEEQNHTRQTISNMQSEISTLREQLHTKILEKETLETKVTELIGKSIIDSNRCDEAIADAQKSERLLETKLKEEVEIKKEIAGMKASLSQSLKKEEEMAKKIAELESSTSSLERELDEEKDRSNRVRVLDEELSRKAQIEISLQLEIEILKQQLTIEQKVYQEKMEGFREEKIKIEDELRAEKTALENKIRELEATMVEERETHMKRQTQSNTPSSSSRSSEISLTHKIKELEQKLSDSEQSRDNLLKKLSNLRTNTPPRSPRSPSLNNHANNSIKVQNQANNSTRKSFFMGFLSSLLVFMIMLFAYSMIEQEENQYPFTNWELYTGYYRPV